MGTENPNRVNTYPGPTPTPFAAPRSNMPISSSHPMVGSEASAFRPTPVPATLTTPFSSPGPAVGFGTPGFRPMQPGRPTPSYGPPTTGPAQRFPTPQFPSTAQPPMPPTSGVGQPIFPPTMRPPPPGHVPPMSASLNRQPQIPPAPMGSPPQSLYSVSSRPNMQQPAPPTGPPSGLPGYPGIQSNTVTSPPPPPPPVSHQGGYAPQPTTSAPFSSHQGGYVPQSTTAAPFSSHQGGYVPPQPTTSGPFSSHQGAYGQPPPGASQPGMYVGGSAPPTGAMSGLVEEFSSLSLGSTPGSFDVGLDSKVLPRPLDGDVEPTSFAGMYPMNCNSRFLRLTTSAIPNSQSLVSRWQLPLGAVVCPLAEAPEGEEVPIVNFATTGIVRCRRCRTYVNPYVTFTDGGRKWRCNICALLNDVHNDYLLIRMPLGKESI